MRGIKEDWANTNMSIASNVFNLSGSIKLPDKDFMGKCLFFVPLIVSDMYQKLKSEDNYNILDFAKFKE